MPTAAKKSAARPRHKSFGSPRNEELEPITFDLYEEEFTARPEIQGVELLRFSHNVSSDDQEAVTGALLDFFKTVLYDESYERLEELWHDPDRIVPIETLSDIVAFLVEEYTSRPTEASSES